MVASRRAHPHSATAQHVVVIGAGIGGLTVAALLARSGHRVTVLEANPYPGGCAATFLHKGYRFDAGATVAGGFQKNGPHQIVGDQLGIDWPVCLSQNAWTVHLPDRRVVVTGEKADLIRHFPASGAFWKEQETVADIGWSLAAQGLPWPPSSPDEYASLTKVGLRNATSGIYLLPLAFRTALGWFRKHNLNDNQAFVRFMDGQLMISAQTTSAHANAVYSATALDLPRQGVAHIRGGIGTIAEVLADKVVELGGDIWYRRRVTGIQIERGRAARVRYQIGRHSAETVTLKCDFIVANLTPMTLHQLLGASSPLRLRREANRSEPGWGAFVLHLGIDSGKLPPDIADHHQIITSWDGPLGEGRSVFVSISPAWDTTRAPIGHRAATVTTHTAVRPWWELHTTDRSAYEERKSRYAERILKVIDRAIPGFSASVTLVLPGSPITYQFYTGRSNGMVGGFPETSLLKARGPRTGIPNIRLVGDSIFPGQSTAGVTAGAIRVAAGVNHVLKTV